MHSCTVIAQCTYVLAAAAPGTVAKIAMFFIRGEICVSVSHSSYADSCINGIKYLNRIILRNDELWIITLASKPTLYYSQPILPSLPQTALSSLLMALWHSCLCYWLTKPESWVRCRLWVQSLWGLPVLTVTVWFSAVAPDSSHIAMWWSVICLQITPWCWSVTM